MSFNGHVLALETSSEVLSIALATAGRRLHRTFHNGPQHSEHALVAVDDLLAGCGLRMHMLDAVAFGAGPGAFTGVRLGCGIAQGLALTRSLPVVAVNSLLALAVATHADATADGAADYPTIVSAIDARLGEVYWSVFEYGDGQWRERGATGLARPDAVRIGARGRWLAAGNAFALHRDALLAQCAEPPARMVTDVVPDARGVLAVALDELAAGRGVDAAAALPLYVRDKVAMTTRERAGRAQAAAGGGSS